MDFTEEQKQHLDFLRSLPRTSDYIEEFREYLSFCSAVQRELFDKTIELDSDVLKLMNMHDEGQDVWTLILMGIQGDQMVQHAQAMSKSVEEYKNGK